MMDLKKVMVWVGPLGSTGIIRLWAMKAEEQSGWPTSLLNIFLVVLCNLNGARADETQYAIADLYLG